MPDSITIADRRDGTGGDEGVEITDTEIVRGEGMGGAVHATGYRGGVVILITGPRQRNDVAFHHCRVCHAHGRPASALCSIGI
ncbi:hypothetical protein D3C85_1316060 [compost metagenome]